MPIFTKESLEALRKKIDLVEVLSPYIDLKKAGAAYKALCPFHDEKTPSFTIQRGDSHYHCFGCGAHGDAIHFLMNYQKMNFSEAIESLAAKFQVHLDEAESSQEFKGPPKAKLKEALESATKLFHFLLLHTEFGMPALRYLYERGIGIDFIRQFRLGLSPEDPQILKALAKEKDFSEEILLAAGLISAARRDFFSDRIMFPIHDAMGSVIGFSARKYKEETFGGKYINTTETALFKKSKILFGLHLSRRQIAKLRKAIIVEGQIDALRLIYSGFNYTVAGQGTAFGQGHADELIKLGVQQVYLALDADHAGQEAMVKIGDIFQKAGVEVRIIQLPTGFDPDLFLRKKGPAEFEKSLEASLDYLSFLVTYRSGSYNLDSPAHKNEFVGSLVKQIRSWDHPLMVHESLRKLALLTKVSEEIIGLKENHVPNIYIKRSASIGQVEVDPNWILEVDLLRWLILLGKRELDLRNLIINNLNSDDFFNPQCRKIFELLQKSDAIDLLGLAMELEEGEGEQFLNEVSKKKINMDRAKEQVTETVQKILDRGWMIKRERLKNEIQSGLLSEEKVLELVKQFDEIKSAPPKLKTV